MNVEDEEWIQHALKDYERKKCISKVLSVDCKDAVPKGTNYGCDMLRIKIKAVLHSGDLVNKSVIYKKMPETAARQKLIKGTNVKESKMYTEILPEMERIRQQTSIGVERFSAICYGVKRGHRGLLLEDLTSAGYKLADRLSGLDCQHAEVAIKGLAEFHALTLILIEQGDLAPEDYKDNFFVDNPEVVKSLVSSGVKEIIRIIEEEWQGEWLNYVDKLREFMEVAPSRFMEEMKFSDEDFNVIVHGDYWLTNMMFRYNADGAPLNNRLLDFQIPNYSKAAIDLQYFLNSSLDGDALMKKEEFLKLYYDTLKSYLLLYKYSGEIPTFEKIVENYEKLKFFSLVIGLAVKPFMMQPTEEIIEDLEEWTKQLAGNEMKPPNLHIEKVERVVKILLKQGSEIGVF